MIAAAAIELFGSRGGRAVSISDICKAAGVSRDTYYRCFADKEALLAYLYQTSVNEHIESVLGAWNLDFSNRQWLQQVTADTVDAILRQHKVARFLFVESADPDSPAYRIIHDAYDKAARKMQRWCRQRGRDVPSREFLVAMMVATQWLVHNAILAGLGKREVDKAKEAAGRLFYAGLGLAPSSRGLVEPDVTG